MKRLLVVLFSCFVISEGNTQNADIQSYRYNASHAYKNRLLNKAWVTPQIDTSDLLKNLALLKGRKPGVYNLPQDNMPCIVPDTAKTVKIPNAWRGSLRVPFKGKPPRIPNLIKPPLNH